MDKAFLVQHQLPYADEITLVGLFSSEVSAWAAIDRVKERPGFRDYPDCFTVQAYDFDQDQWPDGIELPVRREIPWWGCLIFIVLSGALVYAGISGDWIALPMVFAYVLFFVAVGALAKRNADRTDFSSR